MFNSRILKFNEQQFLNSRSLMMKEMEQKIKLIYTLSCCIMKFHIILTSCTIKSLENGKTLMKQVFQKIALPVFGRESRFASTLALHLLLKIDFMLELIFLLEKGSLIQNNFRMLHLKFNDFFFLENHTTLFLKLFIVKKKETSEYLNFQEQWLAEQNVFGQKMMYYTQVRV